MFNVIKFVEREKDGYLIPLNNVNDRIKSILGISMSSVERLKREMREQEREMLEKQNELIQLQKKLDQEKQDKEDAAIRATLRLRNPRTRSSSSSSSSSSSVTAAFNSTMTTFMPVAKSSQKRGHFGRPPIILTENQKENVRSSIDIFKTTEENRMDSSHFLAWIDRTASLLRKEFGKYTKIVFVIDNAPWHNRLTNDTMPPKRSWRKEYIVQWLNDHNINVPVKAVKAELLEIAMKNLPEKRYEIDETAKKYNVDILRERLHMDGTFCTSPPNFNQVFIIQAIHHGTCVPVVYALLPNRKAAIYIHLFHVLFAEANKLNKKFDPSLIMTDFEPAIYGHVKLCGLSSVCLDNLIIRSFIRQMMALALVPEQHVSSLFASLGQELSNSERDEIADLFKYFNDH
ncbi:unnamed protein product [Rotaria sordida]|uniref:MULE transposase domain-containing protein n=1 Tax=Rotaria sordida TaxID=392033 RepID=A0A815E0Q3_9BILA|nr:unnamed protein product [Rotaria sordida]